MTDGLEELTHEQVRAEMDRLAASLGISLAEALERLDRGDFDDQIVSSKLRMLRFLEEE